MQRIINPEMKWNQLANSYSQQIRNYEDFPFDVLERFENVKFLEAGSGDGEIAIYMAKEKNCEVVGLEIADSFIDIAEKKIKERNIDNITILKGDVRKMPFKNETFDLVFSGGVIEHFPETFDSLREHVRVLKKDGYLLIGVPCKQGLHYPLKILMNLFRVWNIGYEKSFSKKYFQSKLIENGLEIENSFFLPLEESSNQNSFRYFFTKIFSQIDKLTFGTHMQYYLCKKR